MAERTVGTDFQEGILTAFLSIPNEPSTVAMMTDEKVCDKNKDKKRRQQRQQREQTVTGSSLVFRQKSFDRFSFFMSLSFMFYVLCLVLVISS